MVGAAGRVRIPAVSGPGPVPWRAWARSLVGLTPTQAAVVAVLAELADWRGEMVVSVAWLAERSMRPVRSVKRALAGLEADGVIVRRRRRSGGHQGASLVSLVPAPVVRPEGDAEAVVYAFPDVRGAGPVVEADDDEGLRAAIVRAAAAGWLGEAAEVVCRSLRVAAPVQLATAIERGRVFSRLGAREALLDTISWAWQVLREDPGAIASARSPWAMWTARTTRAVLHGRDGSPPGGVRVDACDPADLPDPVAGLPGETGPVPVGLGEMSGPLAFAVGALVRAGMSETTAWAGTMRIAQLALRGRSRAHTAAAQDPRLEDLGVSPECARAWMTLVMGTRRGTRAPLLDAGADELARRAEDVVAALNTAPEW